MYRKQNIYAIAQKFDDTLRATPICPENDVALVTWGYGEKERMPYSFLKTTELEFEGHMFLAPYDWDVYLSAIFGDYMTPPPADAREAHYCSAYWKD